MMARLLIIMLTMAFSVLTVSAQAPIKKPVIADKKQLSKVSVSSATGTIGGYGYVDMGLSVKWATCNVGARSPEGYGSYFAWGETTEKSSYDRDNCPTDDGDIDDISGNSAYDAARANWGSTWRMPTEPEFQELIDNCDWTWTTYNGKKGYKVVSKKNNNSIFLPASGYRLGTSLDNAGSSCSYWSSTPDNNCNCASHLSFYGGSHHMNISSTRYVGRSVRPVSSASTSSSASATSKPSTGGVSVQYTPNGATVYVDGTNRGTTPCEISGLSVGSHTVEISLNGYETVTRTIEIKANGVREIAGTLTRTATAGSSTSSGTSSSKTPVSSAIGTIAGHEYVDLGLSVKWATCNVGASSPVGYGSCFAWGETTTKEKYKIKNSKTYGKSFGDISGNSAYDAARANWGSTWRLPTEAEFLELIYNCEWTPVLYKGRKGYMVVSKKNNNSIFLPAAGYRYGSSLHFAGELGFYWSSSPSKSDTNSAYGWLDI